MTISELHPPPSGLVFETINIQVDGVAMQIATMHTLDPMKTLPPILFLHGFGSTKEDYADAVQHPHLAKHPILAYDAPGTGDSTCSDLSVVDIPFLVKTAQKVLAHFDVQKFYVIGHSMGGLTALLLAHEERNRVLGFIDIEGNVTPEDCFLSRQVTLHAHEDPNHFFKEFILRAKSSTERSSALYAASLQFKVRAGVMRSIFESMVELSDHEDLMSIFLSLPCLRMFMYGEDNSSLSYLKELAMNGVKLAEIPLSGHWPMYSNPVAMWDEMAHFIH